MTIIADQQEKHARQKMPINIEIKDCAHREELEFVRNLAHMFRYAVRIGADDDIPEGARYIRISDTLAVEFADKLEDLFDSLRIAWYRGSG